MSSSARRLAESRPGLSLFVGEPSTLPTLPIFYETIVLPQVRLRKGREADWRTIDQDREALRRWEEIVGPIPLDQITKETCKQFVDGLFEGNTRGVNTVVKICTHIQQMLCMAGPPRQRKFGAELLDQVPWLDPPTREYHAPDKYLELAEIAAWIRATEQQPRCMHSGAIDTGDFLRALIVWSYNIGLRIGSSMAATWSMVDAHRRDWISIPNAAGKRGKGGQFYLNRYARAAIESIRRPGEERLFPWHNWPTSKGRLYQIQRESLARAGLPDDEEIGQHALRRSLLTWVAGQNAMVAAIVAGHHSGSVTRDFYVVAYEVVPPVLDRVPQDWPTLRPRDVRQARLFD